MNNFDWKDYVEQSKKTVSPHADTDEKKQLMYGLGVADEAGEVAGVVKKLNFHGMSYEEAQRKILEECGDTLWYMGLLLDLFDFTLEDAAQFNMAKLQNRHKNGKFEAGYESDSVKKDDYQKVLLIYGFSDDVDNYVAGLLKEKHHERSYFYMSPYSNLEVTRALAHGYETILVDAERGDRTGNQWTKDQARAMFGKYGVIVQTIDVPPSKLELS